MGTRNKHSMGPFKNTAGERVGKLYSLFAEKFQGAVVGDFHFGVDASGYAFIEERREGCSIVVMFVYLVWQESWSSMFSRRQFMQGKICYTKQPTDQSCGSGGTKFYSRQ